MSLKISTDPAPLVTDDDGVVRVVGTRVRLDTVIYAFNQGVGRRNPSAISVVGALRQIRNDQLLLAAPKLR
ncbi:MAG TPA: hypothetical protein VE422_05670 [Terriglobia bacterium]|nr:hypothetical protein [Terriglobia bacterium]